MPMSRTLRRVTLAVHLTASIGWIGSVVAYLVLAFAVPATHDPETVRAAWVGMELVGWYAVAPLAVAALLTGTLLALGTRWGLFRHWWVVVSFVATTLLTGVLLLHLPDVTAGADRARAAGPAELTVMGSDIVHAAVGLALLLGVLYLNLTKPAGLTRYGWRKQHQPRVRGRR